MIYSSGDVIRLCWFLLFFLPFAQSQFGNGLIDATLEELRGQGLPFPFNVDGSNPNRFSNPTGENRFEEPQGERAGPSVENAQDEPVRQEAETTQPPSTLRAAIPEPETTGPPSTLRAAIPSPEPTSSAFVLPASSLRAAIPSPIAPSPSRINVLTSTGSATSTMTVSTTVLVTPSADAAAEEAPFAAATESAADEDLLITGDTPMSASAMAGVGVGITFGVLSIAGITGFYLWRRYRSQQGHDDTTTAEQCNILGRFFGLKKYKDNKQDPEWSIESAEKVPIVKNMRAQSVSTVSRSNSRDSDEQRPSTRAGTGPGVNSTVVPPRRNVGMQNTALKSHPITPDASAFPVPPSFPGGVKLGDGAANAREQKSSNWPLPD